MHKTRTYKAEGDINLSLERLEWMDELSDSTKGILQEDQKYFIHQSMSTPCMNVMKSCKGIYITDNEGKTYMDFHGNNVHQVGFSNEDVVEAIKSQLDELSFCTRRYTNEKSIQLAKKLTTLAPGRLNKLLFAPGATSSIGMALKLTRIATGKYKTLSMWDSFHGASMDAISIGGESSFKDGLGPLLAGCEHTIPYNSYRCFMGECKDCELKCVDYIEFILQRENDIGGIIIETIRNTDVQIPTKQYYKKIRALCDKYNVLLILDETAIGLGRTGKMFAFEHFDIEPDMVVLGKGLGGGVFPLSTLIVNEKLDIAKNVSLGHYTHEKTPVGSAASLAAINYIEENNILQHVEHMSAYIRQQLEQLAKEYEIIGDIRGIGLLYGVELVKDKYTKEKAIEEAEKVMYSALRKGMSFKISQGNVITLSPPLIITKDEIDKAIEILKESLKELN
ncbi:MAG: (R)-1-hydroxy-2-aminoethylphosphonate ammonia-lyase [Peptostreptococcaceae bacterium]